MTMNGVQKMSPEDYPEGLRQIPKPPKELFYLGQLPDPKQYKYLVIIGARNHTSYGRDAVRKIIERLAGYPICIVSGLALGIDTLAHKYAIENNLKTVAIPGSGIDFDVIHPRTNVNLAREIVSSGNCILSEMLPNQRATIYSFPQRNRIMAGLADAVLIIEAEEKSGTLITARLTLDYNRELFVIPGSIFSETSIGTNKLIKQGATPVTSADDILDFFGFQTQKEERYINLAPEEQAVYTILNEPLERDELIDRLGMTIHEAQSLLTMMEIKGLIYEEFGLIKKL